MDLARRHAYLHALGIDLWLPRAGIGTAYFVTTRPEAVTEAQVTLAHGLHIGPGDGNTLLLCRSPVEAATRLATDIARCLDTEPVWSWPTPADSRQGVSLQQAIEQRLFTRLLVFGQELGGFVSEFVSGSSAQVIASARILRASSMAELAGSATAKQRLWSELCANGWCAERARNA